MRARRRAAAELTFRSRFRCLFEVRVLLFARLLLLAVFTMGKSLCGAYAGADPGTHTRGARPR